jgi:hypothetical protein
VYCNTETHVSFSVADQLLKLYLFYRTLNYEGNVCHVLIFCAGNMGNNSLLTVMFATQFHALQHHQLCHTLC